MKIGANPRILLHCGIILGVKIIVPQGINQGNTVFEILLSIRSFCMSFCQAFSSKYDENSGARSQYFDIVVSAQKSDNYQYTACLAQVDQILLTQASSNLNKGQHKV